MKPDSRAELAECFARFTSMLETVVADHNRMTAALHQLSLSRSAGHAIEIASASATVRIEMVTSRAEVVVAFRPNNRHDSGVMSLHRLHRLDDGKWMFDEGEKSVSMEQFAADCVQRLRGWE